MSSIAELPHDIQQIIRQRYVETVRHRALRLATVLDHVGMLHGHLQGDVRYRWLQYRHSLYNFALEETHFLDFVVKLTRLARNGRDAAKWMYEERVQATNRTIAALTELQHKTIQEMTMGELLKVLRLSFADIDHIQWPKHKDKIDHCRDIVKHIQNFLYGDRSYDDLNAVLLHGVGATTNMMTRTQYGAFELAAKVMRRLPLLLQSTALDELPNTKTLQEMACGQVQEMLKIRIGDVLGSVTCDL